MNACPPAAACAVRQYRRNGTIYNVKGNDYNYLGIFINLSDGSKMLSMAVVPFNLPCSHYKHSFNNYNNQSN